MSVDPTPPAAVPLSPAGSGESGGGLWLRTVYKYAFPVRDDVLIRLPQGARILRIADQRDVGDLILWALVDPAAPLEARQFKVRGTGHSVGDDCGAHLATVVAAGGYLVWHIFEAALASQVQA